MRHRRGLQQRRLPQIPSNRRRSLMMNDSKDTANPSSRRDFLKASGVAAVGSTLAAAPGIARIAHPGGLDTIRIGLVGCGGRGNGAAENALSADPNVMLTALGDVFEEPI